MSKMNEKGKNSRREFLKLGALASTGAGASMLMTSGCNDAKSEATQPKEVDVVIVGAGASGLYAAKTLTKEGKMVAVLEADTVVGGRLRRGELAGQPVDIGGQWWGPTQNLLDALLKEYGLERIKQNTIGKNVIKMASKNLEYRGEVPELSDEDMQAFGAFLETLETLSADLDTVAPWKHPKAKELDGITAGAWIDQNISNEFIGTFMKFVVLGALVVDPSMVSMLQFLFYMKSGGGFMSIISTDGGAQQEVVKGGLFQAAYKMAEELGDAVFTGNPVRFIEQDDTGVTVKTDNGVWKGKKVILALAPPMTSRIHYTPPLPASRDMYTQRNPMGMVIKCWIAYDKPFWRDKGYTGQVFTEGDFNVWFENSLHDSGKWAIVGFIDGSHIFDWVEKGQEEREKYVKQQIAKIYGDEALNNIDYIDQVWTADEWRRGCYGAQPTPGMWTSVGKAWKEPIGHIHIAGTDSSEVWNGYVEGALYAGKRAAEEVIAKIEVATTT